MEDATALAARVRSGEVSAAETVSDAIDAVESLNPTLNAVVIPLYDRALQRARSDLRGPFAGVPIVLKDMGAAVKGMQQHQGSQLLRRLGWRAGETTPLMERILAAGFIPIGKTNVPEFGAGATTQPLAYGPTRNPWDLARSTSGSSGGAAAALASGMTTVAHASDFGGSIRMPAAWCGVIGLKPSGGLVTMPAGPLSEFVLTMTLRDTAAMLDVLAEPNPDAGRGSAAGRSWLEALAERPRRLRIGLTTSVEDVQTDRRCSDAAVHAAGLLAAAGHEVIELDDRFLADDGWNEMHQVLRAEASANRVRLLAQLKGAEITEDDAEPLLLALAALAPSLTDQKLAEARAWDAEFGPKLLGRWEHHRLDVVLSPTTGIAPRLLEEMSPPANDPASAYLTYRQVGCFAGPWNKTGQPAITLPWWAPEDQVPVGVQIVGPVNSDGLLLQLAHELAELAPASTTVRRAEPLAQKRS